MCCLLAGAQSSECCDKHQDISLTSASEILRCLSSFCRSILRSTGTTQYKLVVARRASKFAERSFSVYGSAAWN